ncbi:MAG: hypothetical protein ACJ8BW_37900 [Ktedonobacteraceae bacterium]
MKHVLRWPVLAVLLSVVLASGVLFALIPFIHRGNVSAVHASGVSRAATSAPSITPSTTIFRPLLHIPVLASGFSANDRVEVYLDSVGPYTDIGTLFCDAQGNCSGTVYIERYTAIPGPHILIGEGSSGLAQAAVTEIAGISASPNRGGQGTPINLVGAAFAHNETVKVYWGNLQTGKLIGTVTSDSQYGMFSLTLAPPTGIASGSYPITVLRTHQKPGVVTTWFKFQAPRMHVSTPGVRAGYPLVMNVAGFQASEQVTLSWSANGGQTLATFLTDSSGMGGTAVIPPAALPGTYILTAVGMSSGFQLQSNVAIGPGIGLNYPYAGLGQTITVTGGGFSANETIDVYLQRRTLGVVTATSDAIGNFTVSLTMPDTFVQGQTYHVYAVSTTNSEHAQVLLTFLLPGAGLYIVNTRYGEPNTVYGSDFAPGEKVKLIWDYLQPGQLLLATAIADSTGSFILPITTPSDPNLSNVTLTSIGLTSKIAFTSQIYESPGLVPQPTSGPDGSRVHVSGGGFDAGETVSVSFLGQTVATAITDQTGHYSTSFVLPQATGPGLFSIDSLGATSQLQTSANFVVTPKITITPATGPSNTVITVTGNSFRPTETVSIWWYDQYTNTRYSLTTVTTTQQGTFKALVKAEANLVSGNTYDIQAIDQQGGFTYLGQAIFTAQ